jgi:hypothetical protein
VLSRLNASSWHRGGSADPRLTISKLYWRGTARSRRGKRNFGKPTAFIGRVSPIAWGCAGSVPGVPAGSNTALPHGRSAAFALRPMVRLSPRPRGRFYGVPHLINVRELGSNCLPAPVLTRTRSLVLTRSMISADEKLISGRSILEPSRGLPASLPGLLQRVTSSGLRIISRGGDRRLRRARGPPADTTKRSISSAPCG